MKSKNIKIYCFWWNREGSRWASN